MPFAETKNKTNSFKQSLGFKFENRVVDGGTYWSNGISHPGAIVSLKMGAEDKVSGPQGGGGKSVAAMEGGCTSRRFRVL